VPRRTTHEGRAVRSRPRFLACRGGLARSTPKRPAGPSTGWHDRGHPAKYGFPIAPGPPLRLSRSERPGSKDLGHKRETSLPGEGHRVRLRARFSILLDLVHPVLVQLHVKVEAQDIARGSRDGGKENGQGDLKKRVFNHRVNLLAEEIEAQGSAPPWRMVPTYTLAIIPDEAIPKL